MYKKPGNAIQRARNLQGVTQEKLAEMCGYSVDSIRAWENGARGASVEVLDLLGICLDAPWLTPVYLREQSENTGLSTVIPDFIPGSMPSQATLKLLRRLVKFSTQHSDLRLAEITEDNVITATERPDFDAIMADLSEIVKCVLELQFSGSTVIDE